MTITFKKLVKSDGEPSELERTIATYLSDLATSEELKNQINELYFVGAEVCFALCFRYLLYFRNWSMAATRAALSSGFHFLNFVISKSAIQNWFVNWRRSSTAVMSSSWARLVEFQSFFCLVDISWVASCLFCSISASHPSKTVAWEESSLGKAEAPSFTYFEGCS